MKALWSAERVHVVDIIVRWSADCCKVPVSKYDSETARKIPRVSRSDMVNKVVTHSLPHRHRYADLGGTLDSVLCTTRTSVAAWCDVSYDNVGGK